jgi:multiple sugar transport system permease protein
MAFQFRHGYVVILTAGMLNIPMELHDAATVDGVNGWQRFRFMTLPLLSHTLALVMVILAIGALQEFTGVFGSTRKPSRIFALARPPPPR